MRRSYLFVKADDIVFEYQLSEFELINKIRKSCETEKNKNTSHVVEWLKSMDNASLVRMQCEAVYFFLFCTVFLPLNFVKSFLGLRLEVPSRDLNGDGDN